MPNGNRNSSWDNGKIYAVCIGFGTAVEITLDVVQGTLGLAPLAGFQLAQIGAVFGIAIVAATVTTISRELF